MFFHHGSYSMGQDEAYSQQVMDRVKGNSPYAQNAIFVDVNVDETRIDPRLGIDVRRCPAIMVAAVKAVGQQDGRNNRINPYNNPYGPNNRSNPYNNPYGPNNRSNPYQPYGPNGQSNPYQPYGPNGRYNPNQPYGPNGRYNPNQPYDRNGQYDRYNNQSRLEIEPLYNRNLNGRNIDPRQNMFQDKRGLHYGPMEDGQTSAFLDQWLPVAHNLIEQNRRLQPRQNQYYNPNQNYNPNQYNQYNQYNPYGQYNQNPYGQYFNPGLNLNPYQQSYGRPVRHR